MCSRASRWRIPTSCMSSTTRWRSACPTRCCRSCNSRNPTKENRPQVSNVPEEAEPWHGHVHGSDGYRRMILALFAAGVATFSQLYSVQGVLPELARDLAVTEADAALAVSAATLGL